MTAHWIVISARHVALLVRLAGHGVRYFVKRRPDAKSFFLPSLLLLAPPSLCVRYHDAPTRFSFVMVILSVVANLVSRA